MNVKQDQDSACRRNTPNTSQDPTDSEPPIHESEATHLTQHDFDLEEVANIPSANAGGRSRQSCLRVGDELHVHFQGRPAPNNQKHQDGPSPATSSRDRSRSSKKKHLRPSRQFSAPGESHDYRGRSPSRPVRPSLRPRRSDLPDGRYQSRTSVESYGRHALDNITPEPEGEPESYLELPHVDVPGAVIDEETGWSLTDHISTPSSGSSASSYLRAMAFAGHRDTFARISFRRRPAPVVPTNVWLLILAYLSHRDFLHLRLSAHAWYLALPFVHLPSSYHLPIEIIQSIYQYLAPHDFNSARHVCKSWFVASLDRELLALMLRKGGWWTAGAADLELRQKTNISGQQYPKSVVSPFLDVSDDDESGEDGEIWLLSKRLATECTFRWDWKGNGLQQTQTQERMSLSASVDFSKLIGDEKQDPKLKQFTVSGCGRFLLVNRNCIIYVYRITANSVFGVTSIFCPRRIIAVSMDTSSQRYAVAALLEGRMGLVCDIHNSVTGAADTAPTKSKLRVAFPHSPGESRSGQPARYHQLFKGHKAIDGATRLFKWRGHTQQRGRAPISSEVATYRAEDAHEIDNSSSLPLEPGQRSIYRNLCSADDPPRSVAICPQRRCVAFGCRLGIELHWVDALTGQDLNRWFPLAAPSDYLYFLPPRPGIDNAKKLRLISSAAGPVGDVSSGNSGTNRRRHVHGHRSQSMTRLFFGNLPSFGQHAGTDASSQGQAHGLLRTVDCDHFHAIPLSDGAHMLFTDPQMGCLCLGSDAPLGGPTKLLRKVICIPPADLSLVRTRSEADVSVAARIQQRPIAYSAGSDLQWGIRIVAAYPPDRLILFCVPPDLFENLKDPACLERGLGMADSDLLMDAFLAQEESPENADIISVGANEQEAQIPIAQRSARIHGTSIGYMRDVVDISVDASSGDLRVWAFSHGGEACVWHISTPWCQGPVISRSMVNEDGTVVSLAPTDQDGDIVMRDVVGEDTYSGHYSAEGASENSDSDATSTPSPRTSPLEEMPGSKANGRHVSFFDGASSSTLTSNSTEIDGIKASVYEDLDALHWTSE